MSDSSGVSILIVDDTLENRELLAKTLDREGVAVSACASAEYAREMLNIELFSLILLDISMPGGMSGIEFLKEIKGNPKLADIPVVMVSASGDKDNVIHCLELGAKDFIIKPFDLPLLKRRIDRYISEASNARQGRHITSTRKFNILIVDDNELNRDILQRRLDKFGFLTKVAAGGDAAIECINKYSINLVLLDIMMPEKDGVTTLLEIRQDHRHKNLPIIMLTALSDKEKVHECITSGADDYIIKPFETKVLKARIDACLTEKSNFV